MASKICAICGKKSGMNWTLVKLRGKYNPTQKLRKYPNLQWVRLPASRQGGVSGKNKGKRVLACAKCIKRLSKV